MASTGDFSCEFLNCGRRFKRQEHLTRHERCHDPANIFVCEVCQKEFNRKDSLNRHLMLHSDVLTPSLPKKTKRACFACRRGKNKCDGEASCSSCVRRDVECRYQEDDDVAMGGVSDGVSPDQNEKTKAEHLESLSRDQEAASDPRNVLFVASQIPRTSLPTATSYEESMRLPLPFPKALEQGRIINWMSVQVRQDPLVPASCTGMEAETKEERLKFELYTGEYFKYFHHRWTIVNRPIYESTGSGTPVVASVRMIGAWLVGTVESKEFAWTIHKKCMLDILPKVHRVTCHDNLWEALSAPTCHSVLLNIIFCLYTGNQTEISRGFILLKTLVAALRELGLFDEDTAWPDEKANLFLPMQVDAINRRQRLAIYLFKIDTYLSILRNQPPSLSPQDLHFPLLSTHAAYNADGLHIWEERNDTEPVYRSQITIIKMITDNLSGFHLKESNPMFIEDIQICMCASWSSIWKLSKSQQLLRSDGATMIPEKTALRQQLEAMKSRLDRIQLQLSGTTRHYQADVYLPPEYYFGCEDTSDPSSASIVTARMQDLVTDTMMLYHLLSISLSSILGMLVRLAKDRILTPVEEASKIQAQAREERIFQAKQWAASPDGRRSLCHSIDILMIARPFSERPDPISHIASGFAAIVVYTFSTYGTCACVMCVPNPLVPVVEMTKWSRPGCGMYKQEREAWIEFGLDFRPQLQGIQMCRCNSGFLTAFFRSYLPEGWEVASMIPDVRSCAD